MTFDMLTLAQLALIIVFGYTVLGLTGFGSSVTAMPLLVLFIPLRTAVPLMLVFDLVSNVLLGLKNRRFIEKREALRLIPFMVAGMAVGVLALVHAPERTLLVVKVDEKIEYAGGRRPLFVNRWSDGTVDPSGHLNLEAFRLEGTTPVWTYACADALLEKRVFMERGANTTYVQYRLRRASGPATLHIKALVNYRDYHATTRGDGWQMRVEPIPDGLRVTAFDGARPDRRTAEAADQIRQLLDQIAPAR